MLPAGGLFPTGASIDADRHHAAGPLEALSRLSPAGPGSAPATGLPAGLLYIGGSIER